MAKVFLADIARCSGCYNCQLSCKDEHCENDWRPYAAPQPRTGQFWCKVHDHVRGTIPKVKIHYITGMCAHCADAACMRACPENAIVRRPDQLVLIDPQKCTGCGACADACYFDDVIYMNQELKLAQKCTGCVHLLDNGRTQPRCVEACPTDALRWIDEEDLPEDAHPIRDGIGARLYYRNIPGRFIGGLLYDPDEEEVIIGAKCTLTGAGTVISTESDSWGDFWFKNLKEGSYELTVSADGYRSFVKTGLVLGEDINLGDIPMERD